VVVLGGTDIGKSSFCRLLCSHIASLNQRAALLDTDLGQKMIGPPACVSLATCAADTLDLKRIRFVGEASAAANIPGVIASTARLARESSADRLVVNTSGLITGPASPSSARSSMRLIPSMSSRSHAETSWRGDPGGRRCKALMLEPGHAPPINGAQCCQLRGCDAGVGASESKHRGRHSLKRGQVSAAHPQEADSRTNPRRVIDRRRLATTSRLPASTRKKNAISASVSVSGIARALPR
jgi:hypothetical protein